LNRNKYKNLKKNAQLLTSPFDIHATIRDLTCTESKLNQPKLKKNEFARSISLLKKIPPERNCDHIGISEHFCTCQQGIYCCLFLDVINIKHIKKNFQDWQKQRIQDTKVVNAAYFAVKTINQLTRIVRNLCTELYLRKITYAESLVKNKYQMLKVQFVTSPNKGKLIKIKQ